MTKAPESSLRDHLTTTTDEGKIDLTVQELSRVTGGKGRGGSSGGGRPVEYLKIKLQEVFIS